jgi:hypothetical protein
MHSVLKIAVCRASKGLYIDKSLIKIIVRSSSEASSVKRRVVFSLFHATFGSVCCCTNVAAVVLDGYTENLLTPRMS